MLVMRPNPTPAHQRIVLNLSLQLAPFVRERRLGELFFATLMEAKLQDYWTIGVQECWLVSPEARTVEVLQRAVEHFERSGLYGMGDRIDSSVLADLHLRLEDIW